MVCLFLSVCQFVFVGARSSRPAGTEGDCNKTPLHFACELNDKDCVEMLVSFSKL